MAKKVGGWGKVTFNTVDNPGTATEITLLAQDETTFTPETPTEAMASGKEAGAGKRLNGSVRSWDIGAAFVSTLETHEQNLQELYFYFYHLNATDYYKLIKTLVRVDHAPSGETGKHHAVRVSVSGFGATPADVLGLTMA